MRSLLQRGANGVLSACSCVASRRRASPSLGRGDVIEDLRIPRSRSRFSTFGGGIAAGVEEPVQDGEEDGSLDGELEAASLQQLLDQC